MGDKLIMDYHAKVIFNKNKVKSIGSVPLEPHPDTGPGCPELLQASAEFAMAHGGPFVKSVVEHVKAFAKPPEGYWYIVDSKVHMLKPGWYPGIPGWHVDFAPGWTDIVDWDKVDSEERHFACISSDVSKTVFLDKPLELEVPWEPKINRFLSNVVQAYDHMFRRHIDAGQIIEFGQTDLHAVQPATGSGWRIFVRVSITRLRPILNHVRLHGSQVYIVDLNGGW